MKKTNKLHLPLNKSHAILIFIEFYGRANGSKQLSEKEKKKNKSKLPVLRSKFG